MTFTQPPDTALSERKMQIDLMAILSLIAKLENTICVLEKRARELEAMLSEAEKARKGSD